MTHLICLRTVDLCLAMSLISSLILALLLRTFLSLGIPEDLNFKKKLLLLFETSQEYLSVLLFGQKHQNFHLNLHCLNHYQLSSGCPSRLKTGLDNETSCFQQVFESKKERTALIMEKWYFLRNYLEVIIIWCHELSRSLDAHGAFLKCSLDTCSKTA